MTDINNEKIVCYISRDAYQLKNPEIGLHSFQKSLSIRIRDTWKTLVNPDNKVIANMSKVQ